MEQIETPRKVVFIYLYSEEELQLLKVPNVFGVFSNLPVERLPDATKHQGYYDLFYYYYCLFMTQVEKLCAGSCSPLRQKTQLHS